MVCDVYYYMGERRRLGRETVPHGAQSWGAKGTPRGEGKGNRKEAKQGRPGGEPRLCLSLRGLLIFSYKPPRALMTSHLLHFCRFAASWYSPSYPQRIPHALPRPADPALVRWRGAQRCGQRSGGRRVRFERLQLHGPGADMSVSATCSHIQRLQLLGPGTAGGGGSREQKSALGIFTCISEFKRDSQHLLQDEPFESLVLADIVVNLIISIINPAETRLDVHSARPGSRLELVCLYQCQMREVS